MRYECNTRGEWLVNPEELADKLGITSEQLKEETALGLIRIRIECGCDEDEGRSRITVQSRQCTWEGIFDRDGSLLKEA